MEDPENWWTGAHFTGEGCRIKVWHQADGTYVETDFVAGGVRLAARMGAQDSPFFTGETRAGRAVVLQHYLGDPVSLTLTYYETDGTLNYASCGKPDGRFIECHVGR